jgi:uncharacterized C2H2 Zn-finger protein
MAQQRRKRSASSSVATSGGEFKCPECGKTFDRAASLGAHRNRAHGVIGASKRGAARRRGSKRPATTATRGRQPGASIDRNQLLQALFPNGVPPREDVIRRIGNWLDEAEQLAKL